MRAAAGLYPALGRYFRTAKELADAGCMSRKTLWKCLNGQRQFTEPQKTAIANAILGKMLADEIDKEGIKNVIKARRSFDEIFRSDT